MGHDVRIKVVFDYECPLLEPRILTNPHMIQTGHIWFFQLVLGLPLFPMICGSAGSKSRLGKAAGAEVAVWRRNEKLHAAVARSTCSSQNVEFTACSDHFLKF